MTPKEQIKAAIENIQNVFDGKCKLSGRAMTTAIFCMEKQVAKPLRVIYPYGNSNEPETECAVCGNPYANDSHCGTCGQAIDHLHTESEV